MGRDYLRGLGERFVIFSGNADTDSLRVHSSFPHSADTVAAAPPTR
jgi:hypothetical protein